ncbi:MAG: hypothetical protein U0359_29145 [Byssovorax sp.]
MELLEGKMKETPGSPSISTKLEQIAKLVGLAITSKRGQVTNSGDHGRGRIQRRRRCRS